MSGPGKFESEPAFVEAFWKEFLNGGADDDGPDNEIVFFLSEDDWRQWPELDGAEVLVLGEQDNGFVWHDTMSRAHYERLLERAHVDASLGGDSDDEYANNPRRNGTAIDRFAPHPPAKDWRVLLVEDSGPGDKFRYRVVGENLNYLPEDIDYKFSWRLRDLDDPRFDFSRAREIGIDEAHAMGRPQYRRNARQTRASEYLRSSRRRWAPHAASSFGELPPAPRFNVGDRVEVVRGAFAGLHGTVKQSLFNLPAVELDHPVQRLLGPVPFSPSEIRRSR